MIRKKLVLLGSYAVGKTSLVGRFVRSEFSERYQTTVGVKVDKKNLRVGQRDVTLVIWDLHGEDRWQEVRSSYLRGAAGALLVADGTRPETLEVVRGLTAKLHEQNPDASVIVLINKMDLEESLIMPPEEWRAKVDWAPVHFTSAKTGQGVEEAFQSLASELLRNQ